LAEAGEKLGDRLGVDWECPILAKLEELPPGSPTAAGLTPDHLNLPVEVLDAPWTAVAAACAVTPFTDALKEGHDATAKVEAEGVVTCVTSDTDSDTSAGGGKLKEGDEGSEASSGGGGVTGVTGVTSRLVRQVSTALARRLSLDAPQARCSSIVDEDGVEEAAVAAVTAVVAAAKGLAGDAGSSLASWLAAHQLEGHLGDQVTKKLLGDDTGDSGDSIVEVSASSFGSFSTDPPPGGEDVELFMHEDQKQQQRERGDDEEVIVVLPHAIGAVSVPPGAAAAAGFGGGGGGDERSGLVGGGNEQEQQYNQQDESQAVHTEVVRGAADEARELLEELMTPGSWMTHHHDHHHQQQQQGASAVAFSDGDDEICNPHNTQPQVQQQQQLTVKATSASAAAGEAAAAGGSWFFCISPDACNNPIYYWLGNADMDKVKFDLDAAAGPYKIDLGKTLYAASLWPDTKVSYIREVCM
jgi:hypothetical protein